MKIKTFNILAPIAACFSLCLVACGPKDPGEASFDLTNVDKAYNIHTEAQKAFLDAKDPSKTIVGASTMEQSKPNPVKLDYKIVTDNGASTSKETIIISENADMSNSKRVDASKLYNLKVGKKYYFNIEAKWDKVVKTTESVSTFSVDNQAPRNIYLESMGNFRDLGGWEISGDKVVKQGMIYRSPEFNESYTNKLCVSNDDIDYIVNELGIKTDIDLRTNYSEARGYENGGIEKSPLGDTVNYQYCGMKFQGQNVLTKSGNEDSIKEFFNTLADETKYPMVFHCAQGKDRTGCMAFVLNALLGVSQNDLEMDYMFTNFTEYGGNILNIRNDVQMRYESTLASYNNAEGTFQERTYAYLNEKIGVSKENLDKIISLLTESK